MRVQIESCSFETRRLIIALKESLTKEGFAAVQITFDALAVKDLPPTMDFLGTKPDHIKTMPSR